MLCPYKYRNSHPELFCLRPASLLKKETLALVFSCEFCKIFKTPFLYNTAGDCFPANKKDKKVFLEIAKSTGKHQCQSLFFNKVAGQEHLFLKNTSGGCFCFSHLIYKIFHISHLYQLPTTKNNSNMNFSMFNNRDKNLDLGNR